MAIYRLALKIISRGKGHSACAFAAYRGGEVIKSERTGVTSDYSGPAWSDRVYKTEIVVPGGEKMSRSELWNLVEANEKRKDATLAREFLFTLPEELTEEEGMNMVREFVAENLTPLGMIADICVHSKGILGTYQPHAHVMTTMRPWDAGTRTFGAKNRDWNQHEKIYGWRQAWERILKKEKVRHGFELRGAASWVENKLRRDAERVATQQELAALQPAKRGSSRKARRDAQIVAQIAEFNAKLPVVQQCQSFIDDIESAGGDQERLLTADEISRSCDIAVIAAPEKNARQVREDRAVVASGWTVKNLLWWLESVAIEAERINRSLGRG